MRGKRGLPGAGHLPEESLGPFRPRLDQNLLRGTLLHHPTLIHEQHAVGEPTADG